MHLQVAVDIVKRRDTEAHVAHRRRYSRPAAHRRAARPGHRAAPSPAPHIRSHRAPAAHWRCATDGRRRGDWWRCNAPSVRSQRSSRSSRHMRPACGMRAAMPAASSALARDGSAPASTVMPARGESVNCRLTRIEIVDRRASPAPPRASACSSGRQRAAGTPLRSASRPASAQRDDIATPPSRSSSSAMAGGAGAAARAAAPRRRRRRSAARCASARDRRHRRRPAAPAG